MTEPQPLEKDRASRFWILKAVGIAFGLAVVGVAIIAVVLMGVESPSARRAAAVRAAPLDTASQPGATDNLASDASAAGAPLDVSGPTETLEASPTIEPTPTLTPSPTATAAATATPAPTASPTATVKSAARVVATRAVATVASTPAPRRPVATATPIRALDFSFYVKEYCASERGHQILQVIVTAHGGIPPYDYYNDTTQVATATAGTAKVEVKAILGNPVPFNISVVDKAGQTFRQIFFWKSRVRCSWKPLK